MIGLLARTAAQGVLGVALGLGVNAAVRAMRVPARWGVLGLLAELAVVAAALLLAPLALGLDFADEWQTTLPGLVFVWGYFGAQASLNGRLAALAAA